MKVYLDSVGCRLNQSEIEKIGWKFKILGHHLVDTPHQADVSVINTCAVTGKAASDSRQKARQAFRAGSKRVIITGCWVTMEPEAASALLENILIYPNHRKDDLVVDFLGVASRETRLTPPKREPLPGNRQRTRAFIKVQEGCDNFCTFCITRILRGPSTSMPLEVILDDIRAATTGGVKEIVLCGVHLGSWGQDSSPKSSLQDLIQTILRETDITRLRLSSMEPWDISYELIDLWHDQRMCRHLHLPLQSGCDETLKRMGRKTNQAAFSRLVRKLREEISDLAITTDIIVGFPGETDQEFSQSVLFAQEMDFALAHVFVYSPRSGTAAEQMSGQVPSNIRHQRSRMMREALAQNAIEFRMHFIHTTCTVLWESADAMPDGRWRMSGLTDNYLRVDAFSEENRWNQIDRVRLENLSASKIYGSILAAPRFGS